jgi:hypoxanthine-DNA glycosylase
MVTNEMKEIENHPFEPFIPDNASTLIVGSFPGMEQVANKHNPEEWFYSAVDNLFWPILSAAFQIELKTRNQKENFLTDRKIAITDIFTKVKRKEKSNRDIYLTDIEYNMGIESIIEKSKINKLFFTSKFVEKHFLRVFPQINFGVCLPSPSPAANIPISKSDDYQIYKQLNPDGNTQTYRVFKYRQLLS